MKDIDVKTMLRAAGVPRETFSTTLAKMGYLDARAWTSTCSMGSMAYVAYDSRVQGVGKKHDAYNDAELLFYLVAKELALLGNAVYCCDLVDLHNIWVKQEAEDEVYARVSGAQVLCVRNFYEGEAAVFPKYDHHYIASRLVGRHRDNTTIVLLGDDQSSMQQWWPLSFTSYISRNAITLKANK